MTPFHKFRAVRSFFTQQASPRRFQALARLGYDRTVRLIPTVLLMTGAFAAAQLSQAAAAATPPLMDRQKEIALALSACPESIAEKAAVYVLENSGYVKVRDSQNGFTAIVQHSMPTSQEPQCMDAEGARSLLQRMLKVAELRAQGKSPEEIRRIVADLLAKGVLQPPSRPGIDYMLSTENLVPDDKGVVDRFPAHVMFFGTHLKNADLGSGGQGSASPLFVAGEDSPFAVIIVPIASHGGPSHAAGDKASNGSK